METESAPSLVLTSEIPGRGGASLTHISTNENEIQILLACGASREQAFDDFWVINIDRKTFATKNCSRLKLKESDGFLPRNSMAGVYDQERDRVVFFGGQDPDNEHNDLYVLDLKTPELKHIDYLDGHITPPPRNSHTMTVSSDGKSAYLFGGANSGGPLKDLYKLDLESLRFKQLKIIDQECPLPQVEMHTSQLLNDNQLLVLGGRGIFAGQTLEQTACQNSILSIDLSEGENQGKVSSFGALPADLCCHVSALVDNEFLILYGGTNGLRFFDSVLRYSIKDKKWTLMTKIPPSCKSSRFFQDGRISSASVQVAGECIVIFGGSSIENDCNDFLILPIAHLRDDANFSEINEIM